MADRNDPSPFEKIFKAGTPECAVFSAVAAMALGLLLLTVGFWKTVWIALFGAAGGYLGGVKDKKQMLKNVLNRIIPDKKSIPYREQHPEIVQALKDAVSKNRNSAGEDDQDAGQD